MRYSIVFFTALLGSAAATTAGELQDRDLSERDFAEDVGPGLQERDLEERFLRTGPFGRPPGWKGVLPKPLKSPGKGRRPRDVEERDIEERDLEERDLEERLFRPVRPLGWKGIPPKISLHGSSGRRRPRDVEERDLEGRLFRTGPFGRPPGWKGVLPKPLKSSGKGRRPRDIEERALPGIRPVGLSQMRPSRTNRPSSNGRRRRPRDIEERDLEERAVLPSKYIVKHKARAPETAWDVEERDLEERVFRGVRPTGLKPPRKLFPGLKPGRGGAPLKNLLKPVSKGRAAGRGRT